MVGRKRNTRFGPLVIGAEFHYGNSVRTGHLTDISSGGTFLATEERIPVGDRLHLRFRLPWKVGVVTAEAEVRWRTEDSTSLFDDPPRGLGLAFVNLSPGAKERIRSYFSKLEELLEKLGATAS